MEFTPQARNQRSRNHQREGLGYLGSGRDVGRPAGAASEAPWEL